MYAGFCWQLGLGKRQQILKFLHSVGIKFTANWSKWRERIKIFVDFG